MIMKLMDERWHMKILNILLNLSIELKKVDIFINILLIEYINFCYNSISKHFSILFNI
jgi:hypothetical protein